MVRRLVPFLAVVAAVVPCGPGWADSLSASERAEALFDKAKPLMDAGNFADACPLFAESYALDPQVGSLLNLAACYEAAGRTASAWSLWKKGAALAQARDESARAAFAGSRAAELESQLLRLTITVAPQAAQERISLTLDHAPFTRQDWGVALPADPGEHEVEASAPGLRPWSSRFIVAQGLVSSVVVPVLEPALSLATVVTPRSERRFSGLLPVAWTAGGLGLTALGVGTAFGVSATIKKRESTDNRNCVANDCNPTGATALARARQDAQIANVSFAVGAGALVIAAALWLVARTAPLRPTRPTRIVVQPAVAQRFWSLTVAEAW